MKMVSWLDKFAQDRSKINKMKKTAKAIFTAFSSAMAALYFIICYYAIYIKITAF